jgi:hypothetical protein
MLNQSEKAQLKRLSDDCAADRSRSDNEEAIAFFELVIESELRALSLPNRRSISILQRKVDEWFEALEDDERVEHAEAHRLLRNLMLAALRENPESIDL